jgi:hypothetical protein
MDGGLMLGAKMLPVENGSAVCQDFIFYVLAFPSLSNY